MKGNFLKILISYLIFVILLSILNILYNKREATVLAQDQKTHCTTEIPIGETIDNTKSLLEDIIGTTEIIVEVSESADAAGTELTNLADQCKAENCQTGCDSKCQEGGKINCGKEPVNPCCPTENPPCSCGCWLEGVCDQKISGYDNKGKPIYQNIPCRVCIDYVGKCDVLPCSGSPCPNEQIADEIKKIKDNYKKIKVAYEGGELNGEELEGIINLIKKTPEIFSKLGDSRNKLKACASPTEDYQVYLSGGDFSTPLLLKCSIAKDVDSTLGECHLNNYFCCE